MDLIMDATANNENRINAEEIVCSGVALITRVRIPEEWH